MLNHEIQSNFSIVETGDHDTLSWIKFIKKTKIKQEIKLDIIFNYM